jgi:hypothetical protein
MTSTFSLPTIAMIALAGLLFFFMYKALELKEESKRLRQQLELCEGAVRV